MTLDSRNYHGLSFLTAYTFGHAQDDWTKSSQATSGWPTRPTRNISTETATRMSGIACGFRPPTRFPGSRRRGRCWKAGRSAGLWLGRPALPGPRKMPPTTIGAATVKTSIRAIPSPNSGEWQSWNYSGPKSAFSNAGDTPIPCYGGAAGCTAGADINIHLLMALPIQQSGRPVPRPQWPLTGINRECGWHYGTVKELALAALTSSRGACYIQKGGILTPPAYGTLGNAPAACSQGLIS